MSELINILKRLQPCIKGKWFIGDGALLGIHREGDLLKHDKDIDIYLLEGSQIDRNLLKKNNLKLEKYYLNDKVYDPSFKYLNKNPWTEYLSALLINSNEYGRRGRIQLGQITYGQNKIIHQHTEHNIDIFYLKRYKNHWTIQNWEGVTKYLDDDIKDLEPIIFHDIPCFIPNYFRRDEILRRQYGSGYMKEDQNFKYI